MLCNLCKSPDLQEAISINNLPISKDYSGSKYRFDLKLHFCNQCGLLQIGEPIPPHDLYSSEYYTTGFYRPKHIDDLISCAMHYKDPGSLIEIGCNDGVILRHLKTCGFTNVVGVEPNHHAAELAASVGPIYHDYLTRDIAESIILDHGQFDFLLCRHVIEHVSNIDAFFSGIDCLLAPDGILIVEFPNTDANFDSGSPCVLFEEHVNHFTESCLMQMLPYFGYKPLEKRYYTFGGGSIAFVCKKIKGDIFAPHLAKTKDVNYYLDYVDNIKDSAAYINNILDQQKDKDIVLYGAASRSAMFINVMGIAGRINYVFDDRASIHGLIMPGTDKEITAAFKPERPSFGLLGVGCENEWKVAKNFDQSISLFAPRFKNKNFC